MSWFSISALVTRSALNRPATRLYPVEKRTPYSKTRGHIAFKITDCTFCTLCAVKCPTAAIVVDKTDHTWAIDHGRCILCGNCVESCRESCISLRQQPWHSMQKQEVIRYR